MSLTNVIASLKGYNGGSIKGPYACLPSAAPYVAGTVFGPAPFMR
jgi:hypothetical protein